MANDMKNEELIRQHPDTLVRKIVKEAAGAKAVDIHFEEEDEERRAVVKIHNYDEDEEMTLRLLPKNTWVLHLGYYDDEDEFVELLQPLTPAEIDLIPNGLQKVMLKVLVSEEGLRVPGSFLSK
jgi:hypothetical protein